MARVVFRVQGAHFKRQQAAYVFISQAGTWPGHGQIGKKRFSDRAIICWAIICWGLRICAGWWPATLTQSPKLGNTEESRF